jgi:hypothetical protein
MASGNSSNSQSLFSAYITFSGVSKQHVTANEPGIADGGEIENLPPGNRSSLFIQRLNIYFDVQNFSFP